MSLLLVVTALLVAACTATGFSEAPSDKPAETSPAPAGVTPPGDIAFVFSRDGDLYAQTQREVVRITDTPDVEVDPALSSDGTKIVFGRMPRPGQGRQFRSEIKVLDLDTGAECCAHAGATTPALAPERTPGRGQPLAWIDFAGPTLRLGYLEGEMRRRFPLSTNHEVLGLAWDQSAEVLFVASRLPEQWEVELSSVDVVHKANADLAVASFSELLPRNHVEGATYVAPSASYEGTVNVVRICCRGNKPARQTLELGTIDLHDNGPTYRKLADLRALGLSASRVELFTAHAGNFYPKEMPDGSTRWRWGNTPAWFVGDGVTAYLIDTRGEVFRLPYSVDRGISANLRSPYP